MKSSGIQVCQKRKKEVQTLSHEKISMALSMEGNVSGYERQGSAAAAAAKYVKDEPNQAVENRTGQ